MAGNVRAVLCLVLLGVCVYPETAASPEDVEDSKATPIRQPNLAEDLRRRVGDALRQLPPSMTRKIMAADVSVSCSLGLLKVMRGIRNLDPWAIRMVDSTGKFPTGIFQGTSADIGAFDECLATVAYDQFGHERIRGQYCNLYFKPATTPNNDTSLIDLLLPAITMTHRRAVVALKFNDEKLVRGIRLGLCFVSDCTGDDVKAIASSVLGPDALVQVKNCVTSLNPPPSSAQVGILSFFGALGLILLVATVVDVYVPLGETTNSKWGVCVQLLTCFSLASNLKLLLSVNRDNDSDAYRFRFLHGIRACSMFWIVLGHSIFDFAGVQSGLSNALFYIERLDSCIFAVAYLSVDSFFFLSGFLITYHLVKYKGGNRIIIILTAIFHRLYRVAIPTFFVCAGLYLVPLISKGPSTSDGYEMFYEEMRDYWWAILLQMRNLFPNLAHGIFPHLWYMSADFQLFSVALFVILFVKSKKLVILIFFGVSLLCCSVCAWQMYNSKYTPIVLPIYDTLAGYQNMLEHVYMLPTFHAVCYFAGCVMYFVVEKHRRITLSKAGEAALWCIGIACGLTSVFVRYDWHLERNPKGEWVKMVYVFFNRPLWSAFLSVITFFCAAGRGGAIQKFLSWGAFVPLSRLSFGVYLVHFPFYFIMGESRRERFYWSAFNLVTLTISVYVWSYLIACAMFLACEAPTGRIDKLLLKRPRAASEQENNGALRQTNGIDEGATNTSKYAEAKM